MPAGRRYGLMCAIDRWVIRHLCESLHDYQDITASYSKLAVTERRPSYSINLSQESVEAPDLTKFIADQLARAHLSPRLLCFEISVNTALNSPTQTYNLIQALNHLGCQTTLDDAVFNRSTVELINHLSTDYIKLAPEGIQNNNVKDIIAWFQNKVQHKQRPLQLIAKGVESPALLQNVKQMGIQYAQGYQISRPQPLKLDKFI
ncbi:MAG: EAL domain-containing protein [Phormidesmis sp. RL_2_1]|nr:EAL domain-containing protein [Phormidesmis sp. RL_2_1]